MKISIITTFPNFFDSPLQTSLIGKAIKKGLFNIDIIDLRQFTTDDRMTTDDCPYGGGPGMVMKVEPIDKAISSIRSTKNESTLVILLSARGQQLTQKLVYQFTEYSHLIIICGHYGDVDHRVSQYLVDREVSIGQYVLSGGEVAALVLTDAVGRLIPGVLGNSASLLGESHQVPGYVSPPQYTRPERYRGWQVPSELLSGDPKLIKKWQTEWQAELLEK